MTDRTQPLILVVDDYQDAREMYAEDLQVSGFRVAEARNGNEAVTQAFELKPDLILMDLSLPGMDGWEATRVLKSDERTMHYRYSALYHRAYADAATGRDPALPILSDRPLPLLLVRGAHWGEQGLGVIVAPKTDATFTRHRERITDRGGAARSAGR